MPFVGPVRPAWGTIDGLRALKDTLKRAVSQWPDGPYDWQVEATANVLDQHNQLIIAGCGDGKTAVTYLHILAANALHANPDTRRFGPDLLENPVVLVVTPLKDLGRSQAAEMTRMSIKAIALDSDTVSAARENGRNLYREIENCDWAVVIVSPERLNSPEFDHILRCDLFLKNLALYCVDETHVAGPWSLEFRVDYGDINRVCARIPARVPVLLMTATLTMEAQTSLFQMMGFRDREYKIIRRPVERPNVRTVFQTLTHGLDGKIFPDIAWAAQGHFKTVIYCENFDLGWRVACYLWRLRPLDKKGRFRSIRLYNGLTEDENIETLEAFRDDPLCFCIVATVKFGMGMDLRAIIFVVNLGIPRTPEAIKQQDGRAGRDAGVVGCGITLVEKSHVATMEKDLQKAGGDAVAASKKTAAPTKASELGRVKQARGGKVSPATSQSPMANPQIRRLVQCHVRGECLAAEFNRLFAGPTPSSHELAPCPVAKRRFPCSSCLSRLSPSDRPPIILTGLTAANPVDVAPLNNADSAEAALGADILVKLEDEDADDQMPGPVIKHTKLTKAMEAVVRDDLDAFCKACWLVLDGPRYDILPYQSFIPITFRRPLVHNFHLIRDREALAQELLDWEFFDSHGAQLFNLVRQLNSRFDKEHAEAIAARTAKAQETRAKNKLLQANEASSSRAVLVSVDNASSASFGHSGDGHLPQVAAPRAGSRVAQENVSPPPSPSQRRRGPRSQTATDTSLMPASVGVAGSDGLRPPPPSRVKRTRRDDATPGPPATKLRRTVRAQG